MFPCRGQEVFLAAPIHLYAAGHNTHIYAPQYTSPQNHQEPAAADRRERKREEIQRAPRPGQRSESVHRRRQSGGAYLNVPTRSLKVTAPKRTVPPLSCHRRLNCDCAQHTRTQPQDSILVNPITFSEPKKLQFLKVREEEKKNLRSIECTPDKPTNDATTTTLRNLQQLFPTKKLGSTNQSIVRLFISFHEYERTDKQSTRAATEAE